ncbi:MAG: hypothetical protein J0I08_22880, partial [Rhizobiales bacterium]|nr:hypothetical protein [Hyphomicrobiales bacterium]
AVSAQSSPRSASPTTCFMTKQAAQQPIYRGSILDADPPAQGVTIAGRITPGFASGGFTGSGARLQPAGIVHAGEFVFNQQATSRLGVGFLNAMHQNALHGYDGGGLVSPYALPSNVVPFRAPANNNGGSVTQNFAAPQIVINGNVGPNELDEVKRMLAQHQKAIAAQGKAMQSAQRYQATGVA